MSKRGAEAPSFFLEEKHKRGGSTSGFPATTLPKKPYKREKRERELTEGELGLRMTAVHGRVRRRSRLVGQLACHREEREGLSKNEKREGSKMELEMPATMRGSGDHGGC